MMYNPQVLGKKVKQLRTNKGYSQKTLATLAGVAQSTLCEFENGISNFNIEKLNRIAKELDTTLDDLMQDFLVKYSDNDYTKSFHRIKFKEFLNTLNEHELSLIDEFLKDYLECRVSD